MLINDNYISVRLFLFKFYFVIFLSLMVMVFSSSSQLSRFSFFPIPSFVSQFFLLQCLGSPINPIQENTLFLMLLINDPKQQSDTFLLCEYLSK